MLHIERELLRLALEAGGHGPSLPAPVEIASVIDRLIEAGLLETTPENGGAVRITDQGREALAACPLVDPTPRIAIPPSVD